MKFCPHCGASLGEGEVCNCDGAKTERLAAGKNTQSGQTGGVPDLQQFRQNQNVLAQARSIPLSVLLTVVTCGLYGFYWRYCILSDIYKLCEEENTAGKEVLLDIVTCGFYGIYLYYKLGTKLQKVRHKYDIIPKDESTAFLILALFRMTLLADIINQTFINNEIVPKL